MKISAEKMDDGTWMATAAHQHEGYGLTRAAAVADCRAAIKSDTEDADTRAAAVADEMHAAGYEDTTSAEDDGEEHTYAGGREWSKR